MEKKPPRKPQRLQRFLERFSTEFGVVLNVRWKPTVDMWEFYVEFPDKCTSSGLSISPEGADADNILDRVEKTLRTYFRKAGW